MLSFCRIKYAVLVAVVLSAAMVLSTVAMTPPRAEAAAGSRLLGLHVDDSNDGNQNTLVEAIARRETDAGRRLDLVATKLYGFTAVVPSPREGYIAGSGHIPLVNWATAYTPAVASGSKDSVLRAQGASLRNFGSRVLLRFDPSMDKDTASVTSPASFQAAWQRAHNLFVAAGANNVEWVWCPSSTAWANGTAMSYYPGDAYVDWTCAEGLNTSAAWTSFNTQFGPFYDAASAIPKRMMIGSFGTEEGNTPSAKATWITSAYSRLVNSMTNVEAAVYEDTGSTSLSTDADAVTAWNAAVVQPALYTRPAVTLPGGPGVPAAGTLLGALQLQLDRPAETANWNALETASGRPLDLGHTIYRWGATWPTWRERWHSDNGRLPMVSWGGTDTNTINSGANDAYIHRQAQAVRTFASPIMIRWFWEMDGGSFDAQTHGPEAFKSAWIRIRDIFRQEGVSNAIWVWSPNSYGIETGKAQGYYPGAAQVDWIGGDGFDWYPQRAGSSRQSFAGIFGTWYQWGMSQGKPLMIGATGALEDPADPSYKGNWFRDMSRSVQTLFPGIRAIAYFNAVQNSYTDPQLFYWPEDTSASSQQGWYDAATDPFFRHNG